ncbi:hypothetical protein [Segatella copri]|uniref:t-SNARE coiled-coil homology domain-containing protein n=1 Tax=Segatella copri TaxID=165179 RepID=A0AAW4N3U9_9BACT|nr:hypothetical protein [Segatella copri]MBV3388276.1 hypothetical protein [Segatella copri]MBV3395723.1 hypothetical protein [Segatella copri]MBV3405365.1 hypothetical protein [Segatella copri]
MKKNILIAIILCVFNSVAAFAQTEKEYSMIISLQNGSTVTLGHNDIKNITFTGDKINAEGNVVTTIEELKNRMEENYKINKDQESRLYKHEDYLTTLDVRNAETREVVKENQYRIEENQKRADYLESRIKDLETMVQDMKAMLEKQNAKISELENKLNEK